MSFEEKGLSLFQKCNNVAIKLIRDPGKKIELLLSRKKENMQEKKSANQKIKKNQFKSRDQF